MLYRVSVIAVLLNAATLYNAEADELFAQYGPNELQEKRQSKLMVYLKLVGSLECPTSSLSSFRY